jgi:hypothetical protein
MGTRQQTTPHILMVRPAHFAFNEETAVNNAFQQREGALSPDAVRKKAVAEFDAMVQGLRKAGVNVVVARDSSTPVKPDAVFPNNWVTFHQEGLVVTYPMFAPTRRRERRRKVIDTVMEAGFSFDQRVNLEFNERLSRFLEGTGSIIFDHQHRLAYACLSPRTDADLLSDLCARIQYQPVVFHASDGAGRDIYHTNVMMALGETFVVVCLDTVRDPAERALLLETFEKTGKTVVPITAEQMQRFAGNMLQVRTLEGQTLLVMSEQAYRSLRPEQVALLETHTRLFHASIDTIETYGGGSARCMMAEIFLPPVAV